jgi:hypothetical protein
MAHHTTAQSAARPAPPRPGEPGFAGRGQRGQENGKPPDRLIEAQSTLCHNAESVDGPGFPGRFSVVAEPIHRESAGGTPMSEARFDPIFLLAVRRVSCDSVRFQ